MSDHRKRTFQLMNRLHQSDLVFEFFFVFSRFEYSLLETGYIRKGKKNGDDVFPDWDRFAREHDQAFTDLTENEQKAVRYYEESPPRKQIIQSGRLTVKELIPTEKERLSRLLILVRRVRNNLFHGEKFKALLAGDSQLDKDYLENGLVILYACLRTRTDISDNFYRETKWELENGHEEETQDD